MSTIPARDIVNIQPGVVSAGGSSLEMNGLLLTHSTRIPIGEIISLAPADISDYLGSSSDEASFATVYGNGFTGASKLPGALLLTQYPAAPVAAWLRGGDVSGLGVTGLQALSGALTVVVDGYTHVISSIDLSGYSSFSAAATAIGAAFTNPTEASFTASIGGSMLTCTSSGTTLTIGTVGSGSIWPGDKVSGTDSTNTLPSGCYIVSQLTGTPGGSTGATYQLSAAAAPGGLTSCTVTVTSAIVDVTVCASPTIAVGQTLAGASVTGTPLITAQLTGTTGGVGTYQISGTAQGAASEAMTGKATALVVTYDSTSGGFLITSGIMGTPSTIAYPTTSALATSLKLTAATGAVLSQGDVAATPSTFMDAVIEQTQNWATFTTLFDPDDGSGNAQKLLFAEWTHDQNNSYAYIAWDTDQAPVVATPATSCLAYLAGPNGADYSGTMPVSEPTDLNLAAFAMSYPACLDFGAKNGRYTMMFRGQSGLTASVSTSTARSNLLANGYNFLGAYASRTETNQFWEPGSILGPFLWDDSYVCQMYINSSLQNDILTFLQQIGTFPYNARGYGLVEAACMATINAGLNFGSIVPGVTLSESQIAYANNLAGKNIASTLSQRGWYLLIQDASSAVRTARQSPPITFFFVDGQSVQYINIASLSVL